MKASQDLDSKINLSERLIEHLFLQGVETFCVAPGSRSSPLALAVARHPLAQHQIHYDERGLAFYALGRAKAARKPVALLVTSGTAVGNILPAVMEASYDHVPLILLTADRPAELRECGANQTVDQVKLFAPYVRYAADLPLSDAAFPSRSLASLLAHAVYLSQFPSPGPVHLNCMLREPFSLQPLDAEEPIFPPCWEKPLLCLPHKTVEKWAAECARIQRGLVLVGALPHDTETKSLLTLAEKCGWPIFPDILSQLRTTQHTHVISYFDVLIKAEYTQPVEAVLHIGGRTLSKATAAWLQQQKLAFYLHISSYPERIDPYMLLTHRLHASLPDAIQQLSATLPQRAIDPSWVCFWKEASEKIHTELPSLLAEPSEPGIIRQIAQHASEQMGLFLANSMPIRDAEMFLPPMEIPFYFFGNRGVSGIDGNIATAIGILHSLHRPMIALLGDLSFLHDINSLALLAKAPQPLCLIVINNGGGGIFSFLPVSKEKEHFEKFVATAHNYTLGSAAALFDIPYQKIDTLAVLESALQKFKKNKQPLLLEITTDRKENHILHEQIVKKIKQALSRLCTFFVDIS